MKSKKTTQEIYINLDDSGKLTSKEKVSVYGGIVFTSKKEKDKFITQYRSIVNEIKCKYCRCEKVDCKNKCPEIKNTNILPSDKRRIMNYIKKYTVISSIVKNEFVYDYIMENKASKGRYIDYTLKMLIKGTVQYMIVENKIDPQNPVKIIVNIDEQTTKSNGYYNLRGSIVEELVHGIRNYDYNKMHKPILYGGLTIDIVYQSSDKSYVIQAADLLAGSVRRIMLERILNDNTIDEKIDFVDYKIIFP